AFDYSAIDTYTYIPLSLHDALPIYDGSPGGHPRAIRAEYRVDAGAGADRLVAGAEPRRPRHAAHYVRGRLLPSIPDLRHAAAGAGGGLPERRRQGRGGSA